MMPHGVLLRGGAEGKIRRGIVEADLFEAVIGLAPNLFFGASIPVAIRVLNRDKPANSQGRVLFVDAAQPAYYRADRTQNFLDRERIASIVAAYRAFEDVERFAHVADLAEIEGNDLNLNIRRNVDNTEPVETLPVAEAVMAASPYQTLAEQQAIAAAPDGVDAVLEVARWEATRLRLLKESEAGALITGRVRVGA